MSFWRDMPEGPLYQAKKREARRLPKYCKFESAA